MHLIMTVVPITHFQYPASYLHFYTQQRTLNDILPSIRRVAVRKIQVSTPFTSTMSTLLESAIYYLHGLASSHMLPFRDH